MFSLPFFLLFGIGPQEHAETYLCLLHFRQVVYRIYSDRKCNMEPWSCQIGDRAGIDALCRYSKLQRREFRLLSPTPILYSPFFLSTLLYEDTELHIFLSRIEVEMEVEDTGH